MRREGFNDEMEASLLKICSFCPACECLQVEPSKSQCPNCAEAYLVPVAIVEYTEDLTI